MRQKMFFGAAVLVAGCELDPPPVTPLKTFTPGPTADASMPNNPDMSSSRCWTQVMACGVACQNRACWDSCGTQLHADDEAARAYSYLVACLASSSTCSIGYWGLGCGSSAPLGACSACVERYTAPGALCAELADRCR